jgi:hypothetical protein
LQADHWFHVANFIWAKLDLLDAQKAREEEEGKGGEARADKQKTPTSPITLGNIYVGAVIR